MKSSKALFLGLVLFVLQAHAGDDENTPNACGGALVRLDDARFREASSKHALLFDQIIKSAGANAGGLITRLIYLAQTSPEIDGLLDRYQDKIKTLLGTAPGTTLIKGFGMLIQVEDDYANEENAAMRVAPRNEDLLALFLNGEYRVVGPELIPDRGRDEKVVVPFLKGIGIEVQKYKLKDRLTPPVADFVLASMMVLAISDPDDLHDEYKDYPEAILLNWTDLADLTAYMKAVVRTTGAGHFENVNAAIEAITPSNAREFGGVVLPKPADD